MCIRDSSEATLFEFIFAAESNCFFPESKFYFSCNDWVLTVELTLYSIMLDAFMLSFLAFLLDECRTDL